MSLIAVYVGDLKHPLEPIQRLLNRANQALQTLERYKNRLDTVSGSLSALEVEDLVTVRDVATVLQRAEMVRRIAEEIEGYIVELGTDGRRVPGPSRTASPAWPKPAFSTGIPRQRTSHIGSRRIARVGHCAPSFSR